MKRRPDPGQLPGSWRSPIFTYHCGTKVQLALETLQVCADLRSMPVAQIAIFLQCLKYNDFQSWRHLRIQAIQRQRIEIQQCIESARDRVTGEWRYTRNHFVQHDS